MRYLQIVVLVCMLAGLTSAKEKEKHRPILFKTESKMIHDACLSVNGQVVVCTDSKSIKAFNVKTQQVLATFDGGHKSKILCLDLSPDSSMVISGGSDSILVLWDFIHHTELQRITFATGKITSVRFSPSNEYVLFGCSNSRSYLYSIPEHKMVHEFDDQKLDITSVAFNPDGRQLAIASADKTIRIYDTSDFKELALLKGHTDWVRGLRFYNNGQRIISCGDDRKLIQWDISNLKNIKQTIERTIGGATLSVDIENVNTKNANLQVSGTQQGRIQINTFWNKFNANVHCPVSKVLFIPLSGQRIQIMAATLGSGILLFDAADMESIDYK